MTTYETVHGDTWDVIARKVYNDEFRATELMQAQKNLPLLDYQVFPSGVTIYVPDVYDDIPDDDIPEWRRE